jgi:hypothetical protein
MFVDSTRSARIAEEVFHSSLASWQRLLLSAATDIREGGWCRYQMFDGDGKKCIMGALWNAAFRCARSVPKGAFETAQYALVAFLEYPVPHWNDRIASDKDEVIHALQSVALGGDTPDDDEPEVRRAA